MSFLLMGDLEEEGEKQLIRKYPQLKTDVLKVGHHGSKTSTTAEFIAHVQPKHSIISCGVRNQFKHPHPEVLQQLTEKKIHVFRTDKQGMIRYEWQLNHKVPKLLKLKE